MEVGCTTGQLQLATGWWRGRLGLLAAAISGWWPVLVALVREQHEGRREENMKQLKV